MHKNIAFLKEVREKGLIEVANSLTINAALKRHKPGPIAIPKAGPKHLLNDAAFTDSLHISLLKLLFWRKEAPLRPLPMASSDHTLIAPFHLLPVSIFIS